MLQVIYLNDEHEVLESWVHEGLCDRALRVSLKGLESMEILILLDTTAPSPNCRILIEKRGEYNNPIEGGYFLYRKDAEHIKSLLETALNNPKMVVKIETLPEKHYEFRKY